MKLMSLKTQVFSRGLTLSVIHISGYVHLIRLLLLESVTLTSRVRVRALRSRGHEENSLHSFAGSLSLLALLIREGENSDGGALSCEYKNFSSIPDLFPLDAGSAHALPQVVAVENVSRPCPLSPGKQKAWVRTASLRAALEAFVVTSVSVSLSFLLLFFFKLCC